MKKKQTKRKKKRKAKRPTSVSQIIETQKFGQTEKSVQLVGVLVTVAALDATFVSIKARVVCLCPYYIIIFVFV